MIGKLVVALAAPLVMSNSVPADFRPVLMDHPEIAQVWCGNSGGTAFRTGPYAYTTAAHVVGIQTRCNIGGEMVPVTYKDDVLDFATLRTARPGKPIKIDCAGFVTGENYWGVGYARGGPFQRVIHVFASAFWQAMAPWDDNAVFSGAERFIPGMSGGPVMSADEVAVGIVKGYDRREPISYARALADTPLCKKV